jgi:hypothetical protein
LHPLCLRRVTIPYSHLGRMHLAYKNGMQLFRNIKNHAYLHRNFIFELFAFCFCFCMWHHKKIIYIFSHHNYNLGNFEQFKLFSSIDYNNILVNFWPISKFTFSPQCCIHCDCVPLGCTYYMVIVICIITSLQCNWFFCFNYYFYLFIYFWFIL